jgi:AraC family transcriptional regulator, melibiose operon regulatory protein
VAYTHELIKVSERLLAWFYLHSENRITFVPTHWHRSLEVTLILKGRYLYIVDGKRIVAKKGDVLVINSGSLHSCGLDGEPDTDALSIIFPYDFLKGVCPQIDSVSFSLKLGSEVALRELKRAISRAFPIFKNRASKPFYQLELNSVAYGILYILLSHFMRVRSPAPSVGSKKHWERCKKLIAYIDQHHSDCITLESIARESGITKEYLARFFRHYMGTTVKKYLTNIRMHYAYRLLIDTDLTELELALRCGFPDSKSFISSFKSMYGTTPLKYRKSIEPELCDYHKSAFSS